MPDRTHPDEDRRRRPRFRCGGQAQINCLPSTGIILPGTIRDLSLHGCCVDSSLPIDCGARAEIVVRVNAASFRAMGEVRAIRGRSGACMEFVQLSAAGKDMLADLVAELARVQTFMDKLRSAREIDPESFRKELNYRKLQAEMLSTRCPFLATILPGENSADNSELAQTASTDSGLIMKKRSLVIPIDLFG
jgi:hypothetical protein